MPESVAIASTLPEHTVTTTIMMKTRINYAPQDMSGNFHQLEKMTEVEDGRPLASLLQVQFTRTLHSYQTLATLRPIWMSSLATPGSNEAIPLTMPTVKITTPSNTT